MYLIDQDFKTYFEDELLFLKQIVFLSTKGEANVNLSYMCLVKVHPLIVFKAQSIYSMCNHI